MNHGLYTGLLGGVKQGVGVDAPYGGELAALLDLDFSSPVTQSMPSTGAAANTSFGATPTHLYVFDESSGNILDKVGSRNLTPAGSLLQAQKALGIWDGSAFDTHRACESLADGGTDGATGGSPLDLSGNYSVLVVFRAREYASINRNVVECRDAAFGAGFEIRVDANSIDVTAENTTGTSATAGTGAVNYADGAWHYALMTVTSGGNLTIDSDLGSGSIAAPTGDHTPTSAALDLLGSGQRGSAPRMQIARLYVWEGTAISAATVASWWVHATDPTGLLTSTSRASAISVPVSATQCAHYGDGQVSIGYHSTLPGGGLGIGCFWPITNVITYSEAVTGGMWNTALNLTATDNDGVAPDEFKAATSLTATAANGRIETSTLAAANNDIWTFSCWIKRNQGTDVTGKISIRDLGNATDNDQTFTATSSWQLVEKTVTLPASGVTTLRCRVYVDTNTESILVWGLQMNRGTGRGAYVRTRGASASLVEADYSKNDVASFPTTLGECEIDFAWTLLSDTAAAHYLYVAKDSLTDDNRRQVYIDTDTRTRMRIYDGAGTSEDLSFWNEASSQVGNGHNYRHIWDESAAGDATGGYEQVVVVDDTTTRAGAASPWEGSTGTGDVPDLLYVGRSTTGSSSLNGYIQRLTIWSAASGVVP